MGSDIAWIQWVVNVGVAGVMLYIVIGRVLPKILDSHREAMEKEESRHAKQEDLQREDFKEALTKTVELSEKQFDQFTMMLGEERNARETHQRSATETTKQHTIAMTKLEEAVRENTSVTRTRLRARTEPHLAVAQPPKATT